MSDHPTEYPDAPNLTVVFLALMSLALLCVCVGGMLIGIVLIVEGV